MYGSDLRVPIEMYGVPGMVRIEFGPDGREREDVRRLMPFSRFGSLFNELKYDPVYVAML